MNRDKFEQIFGFPHNDNVHIVDYKSKKYGLATCFKHPEHNSPCWTCDKGYWRELFGIYHGMKMVMDLSDDKVIYAIAFFVLNDDDEPIELICDAKKRKDYTGDACTVIGISALYECEGVEIEPLEFEI
jgi:hypothetical protein